MRNPGGKVLRISPLRGERFWEITALVRRKERPTVIQLRQIYGDLRKAARVIKADLGTDTVFGARAFADLVVAGRLSAEKRIGSRRP